MLNEEIFLRKKSRSDLNILFSLSFYFGFLIIFDYDELIYISKFKHGFINEHTQAHTIDK
jgi:hypothetical protein